MTENFLFKAIFISLLAHTTVLCVTYFSKMNDPHYKAIHQNRLEISYKSNRHRAVDIREYPVKPAQHLDLSNNQKLFSDGTIPVSLSEDKPMLPFGMLKERRTEHMQAMELSHRVFIRPINSQKINNPVYAAYSEMVRDRINEKANQTYDKMDMGTVYLTFLLDEHGELKDARVVPERTNASEHLQELAMKSLTEASPFPAVLKGMNLREYSFNIEIQYQVND